MSNKRYGYKIIINEKKMVTRDKCFYYNYGSTKGIEIAVFKKAAIISVNMTVKYKAKKIIKESRFKDAVRKALIIHLLKNNENLDMKKIFVRVYDNRKLGNQEQLIDSIEYNCKDEPIIYSMIKGQLEHKIKVAWSNEEIEKFLDVKKSDKDNREAALLSFLNSKNKRYESERFLSLWMAFNGMYGYLDKIIIEEKKKRNIDIKRFEHGDAEQIKKLQSFLGFLPGRVISDYSNKIIWKIKPLICETYISEISKSKLKNGEYKNLSQKIEKILYEVFMELTDEGKKDDNKIEMLLLNGYTYLLSQFTYNFRCNYFHASDPMPLFFYADDKDLVCLKAMNDLLDEFIENNLHLWFSESKIGELREFAKKIVEESLENKKLKFNKYFYISECKDHMDCKGEKCEKAVQISVGEHLKLKAEQTNKNNKEEIIIRNKNSMKIGYVPVYFSKKVSKLISKNNDMECIVVKANKNLHCNMCILVKLRIA